MFRGQASEQKAWLEYDVPFAALYRDEKRKNRMVTIAV